MNWLEWIRALTPPFIDLVKTLAGDEYDEGAELQAILDFNRAVSDQRAKRELRDDI